MSTQHTPQVGDNIWWNDAAWTVTKVTKTQVACHRWGDRDDKQSFLTRYSRPQAVGVSFSWSGPSTSGEWVSPDEARARHDREAKNAKVEREQWRLRKALDQLEWARFANLHDESRAEVSAAVDRISQLLTK